MCLAVNNYRFDINHDILIEISVMVSDLQFLSPTLVSDDTIAFVYGPVAQLVRAPAWHAGGQGFESPSVHQFHHLKLMIVYIYVLTQYPLVWS